MHHAIITNTCFSVHININVKSVMSKDNYIAIFPNGESKLQYESMPKLGVLEGNPSVVSQNNHMPRKRFWVKRVKEIMDPLLVTMNPSAKPKNMQKSL